MHQPIAALDTAAVNPPRKPSRGRRGFADKRERILVAATGLINERGTKGTTLLDVAAMVDLNVTYYFRRKELLAAAVFERSLDRIEAMVQAAGEAPTPEARVSSLIAANVALLAQVIRGTDLSLAKLSDIRTLDDAYRIPLERRFQAIFRQVRGYFGPVRDDVHKALLNARAHMLLEVVFWLPVWLGQYPMADFARVQAHLVDLLSHGIARPGAEWAPTITEELASVRDGESREGFLRVATRLINDSGYKGASVVRIADELNVTKGSFYHHLDAKDDLVLECFRRSYRRASLALSRAEAEEPDGWRRITSTIASLVNVQFYSDWPLLRTTALQSLPADMRTDVVARSHRLALRVAGTLVDGMSDGSVRIVDPLVAAQLIIATVNTAYDLRKYASLLSRDTAIAFYASSLIDGLFDDRVLDGAAEGQFSKR